MSENDLNEEEILQLKTICEFLFFDQYKDNANYETFEQFFSILFIKQINESNGNFSLNEIFKEIVGPKKKYLTYTRFKSAYLKYKNKDSNNSKNFNLFFSSLKTILKLYKFPKDENSEVPFLGEEQEKIIKYTTATYKEKECITNFKIMTNSLNEIFGLNIEYDEIIKCKMYPKKMDLDVKLDINFGILDPEKLKEKKVNKILNIHDEKNIRDSIVYLFGTFDEKKLTFLGIKCRSGKTDFVGKPKGEGFLLGCYGYQFHYIKFDVDKNKGITFFQPYFIYSTRKNIFLSDGIFSKIKEDDLIYDEVEINKINDPNEIDKMITTSVIPDNYFYKNTAEKEEITNKNFKDVSFYEPRKWLLDKNKIKDYLSLDSILNNYELERSKTKINKNDLQSANQKNENYAENYEKNKEIVIDLSDEDINIQTSEKNLSSIHKTSLDYEQLMDMLKYQIEEELKETCENDEEYESKKHFVEEIIKNKDDYKTRGGFYGNFDFEMLNKKLLEDIENINKPRILKTKLKGKQKENETKKEKPNEQNMGYYSQNGNFNNNVFSNAMNFFNEIYGSFDTDNSFQNIQSFMSQEENNFFNQFNNFNNNNTFFTGGFDSNFYQFNNQFNSNNNFYSPFGQRYNYYYVIPTDRTVNNNNNNSRRNEIPYDPKKTQIAQDNWKKVTDSLKVKKGFNLFKRIGWVIRTAKIVENCNKNSAFNKRFPIKEKLKMYKFLEENKKIVDFLSNKSKDNSRKNENNKEFEFIVDEHPEKITNLNEIKRKMDSINKYLNSNNLDRATRRKLTRLYDLYNKQKNILIEEAEKKERERIIEQRKIDREKLIKQEEEKRRKAKEEEEKRIKLLEEQANKMAEISKRIEERKKKQEEENRRKREREERERKEREEREKEREKEREERERKERERKEKENRYNPSNLSRTVTVTNKPIPTYTFKKQKMPSRFSSAFTDSLFPPEKKSLCPVNSRNNWILPKEAEPEDVQGWELIKWFRPEDIFGNSNYQVFIDNIEPSDINQGNLGDCYFLSAVGALSKNSNLIEKLFYIRERSQEHLYGVYLFINGKWKLVILDDYFPCLGTYKKRFAFTSSNENELWIALLEKAWAKVNGSYAKVGCGGSPNEVFDVITESYSEGKKINPNKSNEIWNELKDAYRKGFIMTAGTSGDTTNLDLEEMGLVPAHAYTIIKVIEIKDSRGRNANLVHLRNPWGNTEFSGDWGDSSNKWTPELKRRYGLNNEEKDDGEFFMSFEDFIKYFGSMGICKLYPNNVTTVLRVKKNNAKKQFLSKFSVPNYISNAFISLYQKNPRIILKDGTYQETVTAYLILVNSNFEYVASASSSQEMHLSIETDLRKGDYYIISDINYRYVNSSKIHGYNLTINASKKIEIVDWNDKLNSQEILDKAVISFCKKKLTPQKQGAINIYTAKTYSEDLPFMSILFENTGNYDASVDFNIKERGRTKNFCIYCDSKCRENEISATKNIPSKSECIFKILPYDRNALFSVSYSIAQSRENNNPSSSPSSSASERKVEDRVFKEEAEAIDEDNSIFQYVRETYRGYVIGLENRKNIRLKGKLYVEGLDFIEEENKGKSSITFYIEKKSKLVFEVLLKKRYYGDVFFEFSFF